MKKVIIAEKAGYCFGVKRAMNMAWEELTQNDGTDRKVYAYGPLIHNKQAVGRYEEKGLITVDDIEEIEDGDREMVIRSHGVAKIVYDNADARGIDVVDTTCPFVKKIHNIAQKNQEEGRKIIILGDAKHPEVIGINGWCKNTADIMNSLEEVKTYDFKDEIEYIVVSQTTMNERVFEEIADYLESLNKNINIDNTICSATKVRQNYARKLAKEVDVMVVIGGKHSSNTQKLVKICNEEVKTLAIETKKDLQGVSFEGLETIGVTAGASTPDWVIKETIEYLESL